MRTFRLWAAALWTAAFLLGNPGFGFAADKSISVLGECSAQKKFTMYLGTNDKDNLNQEIPTEKIREEMHEICMKYVDGYTVTAAEGYYRDKNNNISHETSLIYVFMDADIHAIQKIMDEALVKFNQGSILLEENNAKSIFYTSLS